MSKQYAIIFSTFVILGFSSLIIDAIEALIDMFAIHSCHKWIGLSVSFFAVYILLSVCNNNNDNDNKDNNNNNNNNKDN